VLFTQIPPNPHLYFQPPPLILMGGLGTPCLAPPHHTTPTCFFFFFFFFGRVRSLFQNTPLQHRFPFPGGGSFEISAHPPRLCALSCFFLFFWIFNLGLRFFFKTFSHGGFHPLGSFFPNYLGKPHYPVCWVCPPASGQVVFPNIHTQILLHRAHRPRKRQRDNFDCPWVREPPHPLFFVVVRGGTHGFPTDSLQAQGFFLARGAPIQRWFFLLFICERGGGRSILMLGRGFVFVKPTHTNTLQKLLRF